MRRARRQPRGAWASDARRPRWHARRIVGAARPDRSAMRGGASPRRGGRRDRSCGLLEGRAEHRPSAEQLNADRRRGTSGERRDLVNRELAEVAEHDRHAVQLGQRRDGAAHALALLAGDGALVRRGIAGRHLERRIVARTARPVARTLAPDGDRFVRDDAQQPVPYRSGLVVAAPRAECLEKRAARGVHRRIAVAEDAQRDTVQLVLVIADGVVERHAAAARERMGHEGRKSSVERHPPSVRPVAEPHFSTRRSAASAAAGTLSPFVRAVAPRTSSTSDGASSSAFATVRMTASFALPSAGGAVTRTTSCPWRDSSAFADDRGMTWTSKTIRSPRRANAVTAAWVEGCAGALWQRLGSRGARGAARSRSRP